MWECVMTIVSSKPRVALFDQRILLGLNWPQFPRIDHDARWSAELQLTNQFYLGLSGPFIDNFRRLFPLMTHITDGKGIHAYG